MNNLFIHIPKTAGISVKKYLYNKYNTPIFEGHFTCSQMKAKADFINYKYNRIFTIVRNPYSRLVSTYIFLKEKMKEYIHMYYNTDLTIPFKLYSFKDFVDFFIVKNNLNYHYMNTYMFLPQKTWLDTKDKVKIYKLENIKKLGYELEHHNKSNEDYIWQNFYDKKLKEIVYTFYKEDFKEFKYKK